MSDFDKIIVIDVNECVQCEGCIAECPHDALDIGAGGYPFCIESLCTRCGACIEICPVLAISFDDED
ncbi:MAG TPA: ferredoxin [Desulfovibrio sp.]|jgi:MinD superfamily P-loop ATPase containing an inserted ferredoxin domain|nr:4Fe-4S binding protein [Mailhella sp.]HBV41655.1 ferredoxin [Desulfovibrio sp.]